MKKNSVVLLFIILLLASCSGQREAENKDVKQLREKLPKIETPIKFDSDRKMKIRAIELPDNGLIKKLNAKYSYFSLMGKMFETKDNITIIGFIPGDITSPALITFDNQGSQISTHTIFENPVGDMGHYTSNIVMILPNKEIHFTDSTITRKINAEGTDEIPGTDSLSVTRKKYRITDEGIIETLK